MSILIDALIKENLITQEQLQDAKDKQIGAKKPIQELLIEMGFIQEKDLIKISSKVFNKPVLNLDKKDIDPSAVKLISYEAAKRYGVFPVRKEGEALVLAMSDPQDIMTLDDIKILTKIPIKPVLSPKGEITRYIEKYYQSDDLLYDLLKNIVTDAKVEIVKEEISGGGALDIGKLRIENSPVVKLVNLILNDALKSRASDIHIEPQQDFTEIRYRIDGDLRNIMKVPAKLHAPLVARIKILSELDIAETRKSQDGRVGISTNGRKIDIRVATMPTFYGEKVVLRLLDTKAAMIELDKIGFRKDELRIFKEEINSPQGIILVTGPTGSGKTSTLYAALDFINSETKNIITIEDPIEYLLDGINQIQVNPAKNVTFANSLRSILRQDPNVILIGEIRDMETAEISFRSSLTGHLVFSTVHTNSAVATITRLLDIGLEPYLISSSIVMIVAQRLVKLICQHCKEEYTPQREALDKFKIYIQKCNVKKFYRGRGCDKCDYTGFLGRTAIFEILKLNAKIRTMISDRAPENAIFQEAKKNGMKTLAERGIELAAKGITTLEEVAKITKVVEEAPAPYAAVEARERPKILVSDDEEDIRQILEKRLTNAGYDVIEAKNGKMAVEVASRERPDLIVMDVMMPEMDGFKATEILRSRLETAVIPIIMLTAKQDKKSELRGLDAGADDYMTKPFDRDKLLARINMLLKRRTNLKKEEWQYAKKNITNRR